MASSKDYQKLLEMYKAEGMPRGISIAKYCSDHGIEYRLFEIWYKSRKAGTIYPVELVGEIPEESKTDESTETKYPSIKPSSQALINSITIQLKDGMEIHKESLILPQAYKLLTKLEMLCLE